jgi:glyoxylase-like metal-dependent hydrolase (beta-lactamase superfamily II)
MSVIKTGSGVVIYSPVAMDSHVIGQIRELGEVEIIIAPNLFHHMFLRAACAAFPSARVLVPQGLERKIGPLPGADVFLDGADPRLPSELDHIIFSGHAIRETSLFHTPTGTLITADLIYNYQPEQFAAEKLFFRVLGIYGRPGLPFYHRFALQDRTAVERLIARVRSWPVRRIVPCHGRIIEGETAGDLFAAIWGRLV